MVRSQIATLVSPDFWVSLATFLLAWKCQPNVLKSSSNFVDDRHTSPYSRFAKNSQKTFLNARIWLEIGASVSQVSKLLRPFRPSDLILAHCNTPVPLLYGNKELPGEALVNISDEYILSLTKKSVDKQKSGKR